MSPKQNKTKKKDQTEYITLWQIYIECSECPHVLQIKTKPIHRAGNANQPDLSYNFKNILHFLLLEWKILPKLHFIHHMENFAKTISNERPMIPLVSIRSHKINPTCNTSLDKIQYIKRGVSIDL